MLLSKYLPIIEYCADECVRQGSGTKSVAWMLKGWAYAQGHSGKINKYFIEYLGKLVEPNKNIQGFRTIPIGVGNGVEWIEKAQWERVPELLGYLIDSYYSGALDPADQTLAARATESWGKYKYYKMAVVPEDIFYFEYEEIHPFRDGNGRTGKILYNYLLGRLNDPVMPPNFWNIANP